MFHDRLIPPSVLRLLALAVVGPLSAGCVITGAEGRYLEREEKRFSIEGKADVKLMTRDGAIEIRSWDRPEVLVVIEKHAFSKEAAAAMTVSGSQDGNHVTVDATRPRGETLSGLFWGGLGSAKLIVSVPASSDVQATTGDGSIELEGINGTISLRSGDGSISARNAGGAVAARSGDGSITLSGIKGAVDANTGDGSIAVTGVLTGVHARSGDGSLAIHAQAGSTTEADWDLSSGDGSITIDVPESFGAELEAHTGDGRVHLDGVTLSNVSGEIARNRANGRLGAGGHAMRVRTGDGSISIRRVSDR
jgi:putative adhesin